MNKKSLTDNDIRLLFEKRAKDCHKGDFGTLLIVGGSKNYVGAPQLAYIGATALKMGSGIVRLAVPNCLYCQIADKVLDETLFCLPEKKGYIKLSKKVAREGIANTTAVICGMGIGKGKSVFTMLKWLIKNVDKPLLLDADALNLLSKDINLLNGRKGATVLTPHIKEMSRLTGLESLCIKNNKEKVAKEFAKRHSVVVLLKDSVSIITDGNRVIFNEKGSPAMAKGGSGDLLSGIIGGLLARGIEPYTAAAAGAYISGQVAVETESKSNEYSLLPSETANNVERWLSRLIKCDKIPMNKT